MVGHTWQLPKISAADRVASFFVSIGWSGVELFFLLSGLLITGILLDSKGSDHYFRNFYVRRALRIFPLYYAMLASTFAAAALLPRLVDPILGATTGQQLWYVLHLANFAMAGQGKFAGAPLGVTWSLSIEEQFYVAWPFIVWLLPRRWLLRLCLALVLLSFACRLGLIAAHVDTFVVYLLTPSRLGGIALGGAIAIALRRPGGVQQLVPWARWAILVAPLMVVAIGFAARPGRLLLDPLRALLDPSSPLLDPVSPLMDSLGMLTVQLLCAAVIVAALSEEVLGRFARPLETRALRAFGRWSFAMYLFHTPVIVVAHALSLRIGRPLLLGSALPSQLIFTTVCIGITVGLAALSWRFYEQPILGLKRFFPAGPRRAASTEAKAVEGLGTAA